MSDKTGPHLTPTEQRIMDVLRDGHFHTREEMKLALDDELMEDKALQMHISNLRRKVGPEALDVECARRNGSSWQYRLVRLLTNPYSGRS